MRQERKTELQFRNAIINHKNLAKQIFYVTIAARLFFILVASPTNKTLFKKLLYAEENTTKKSQHYINFKNEFSEAQFIKATLYARIKNKFYRRRETFIRRLADNIAAS